MGRKLQKTNKILTTMHVIIIYVYGKIEIVCWVLEKDLSENVPALSIYICIIKRRKLIFVCFSDIPRRAEGNLVGYINNVDLPDATLSATITSTDRGITIVDATLHNVPSSIGKKASLKIQLFLKRKFDIIWFKYIHTRF